MGNSRVEALPLAPHAKGVGEGMPDFLTRRARSALMSRIRGKNTGIERAVFKSLRKLGLRFRRHACDLPGSPDVSFGIEKLAIFVDGDFWHGRGYAKWGAKLKPYWRAKIERNIARDAAARRKLRRMGWRVLRLWGTDIERKCDRCMGRVAQALSRTASGTSRSETRSSIRSSSRTAILSATK